MQVKARFLTHTRNANQMFKRGTGVEQEAIERERAICKLLEETRLAKRALHNANGISAFDKSCIGNSIDFVIEMLSEKVTPESAAVAKWIFSREQY
jgi:hypothetical protein